MNIKDASYLGYHKFCDEYWSIYIFFELVFLFILVNNQR